MAYNIQEQEEIDNFKYLWRNGGAIVCGIIVLVVICYGSWRFYQHRINMRVERASAELSRFNEVLFSNNTESATKQLLEMQSKYADLNVAAMASLSMAGLYFDNDNYQEAQKQLEWVLANNKDDTLSALATQRLASLLLQQKKYDAALAAINKPVNPAFEGMSLDIKGDILLAQDKKADALQAYELAVKKIPDDVPTKQIIQIKIDQLKV